MDQDLFGSGEAGERTDGVTVRFDLGPDLPLRSEGMWARRIARGTYLVTNIPYFAVGVSYLDVVRAEPAEDGRLWAGEVVQRSGNVTVQLMITEEDDAAAGRGSAEFLRRLGLLDVAHEVHPAYALVSMSVAEFDDVDGLLDLLCWAETSGLGIWQCSSCRPWWHART